MQYVATCAFGIEAVLKREMIEQGFTITRSDNGKHYFEGDTQVMMHANMGLRTAERVFAVLGSGKVMSYEDLFQFVKALDLKRYLSSDGTFLVLAKSVRSKLYSLRDIQSITKKALIENLRDTTQQQIFLEKGPRHRMLMDIQTNQAELWLDTSGDALHKRGYRLKQGEAPLKETLAAALVLLSFYQSDRTLYDPFCGSGTIAIEAALIAKNIAPNLNRSFDFQQFKWCLEADYKSVKKALLLDIQQDNPCHIIASDIDKKIIDIAKENAFTAGVDEAITFEVTDFVHQPFDASFGIIITNPPYGARLEDARVAEDLFRKLGKRLKTLSDYSVYILSSVNGVEGLLEKKASRTRVLYNGNIKTRYYQYYGPKPT